MSPLAAHHAHPLRIYDYLAASRARLLDAVRPLTPELLLHPFPFGLTTLASTITHIMISEGYYIDRLRGRAVPPYSDWPIHYERPPAFAVVDAAWREQSITTRAAIAAEHDWSRRVEYDSFPDDRGQRFRIAATAADILTQLALHEVHHRAQAMVMLKELQRLHPHSGIQTVEDVDFNAIMFERTAIA